VENLKELETQLGINFKNQDLLRSSLTHRSYLNEHKDVKFSNERLEFLGDAVLQFLSSRFLYVKYPNREEGDLTNFRASLVCRPTLAKASGELNLGRYLFLSRGEEDSGGRQREYILANTFEALLGAVFLDQGMEPCDNLLIKFLFPKMDEIYQNQTYKDYKSRFQEYSQEKFGSTPEYKESSSWGPDHDRRFQMEAVIGEKIFGRGEGSSKQRAEQEAARDALEQIGI